jgi:hypothetical protein
MNHFGVWARCPDCYRLLGPDAVCGCLESNPLPVVRPGASAYNVGHLRPVGGGVDARALFAKVFQGPWKSPAARAGSASWVACGQHSAGTLWFWRARMGELPRPFQPAPCMPAQAARLRALAATDFLLVELPPEKDSIEAVAHRGLLANEPAWVRPMSGRDYVDALCYWLEQTGARPGKIALVGLVDDGTDLERLSRCAIVSRHRTMEAALAELTQSLAPVPLAGGRRAVARNRVDVEDLGGVAARELLLHLHAASSDCSDWMPGEPPPTLVRLPTAAPRGGFLLSRLRLVGSRPCTESLRWGAIHRERQVTPARGDRVPAWTGVLKTRLPWKQQIHLKPAWDADADPVATLAVALVGIGSDVAEGERRLCELLDAGWSHRPLVLLRHRYTSPRLLRMVRDLYPESETFEVADSADRPWERLDALLRPVMYAIALARGLRPTPGMDPL